MCFLMIRVLSLHSTIIKFAPLGSTQCCNHGLCLPMTSPTDTATRGNAGGRQPAEAKPTLYSIRSDVRIASTARASLKLMKNAKNIKQ